MDAPDDKWQAYWDLHVMAAVRLARGVIPQMRRRGGGVILHNASICAVQPLWYEPIYNVTKSALMMFSKCLATEVVGDNIRVNCINPGLILTPDWKKTARQLTENSGGDWEGYLQGVADEHAPIKRFGTPENSPTSSSSCARTRRPIRSARPTSSTAACRRVSEPSACGAEIGVDQRLDAGVPLAPRAPAQHHDDDAPPVAPRAGDEVEAGRVDEAGLHSVDAGHPPSSLLVAA